MAILNNYNNNSTGKGTLVRFPQGKVTPAGNTYKAYGRNDQTALYNSALHNEYSTIGNPNVELASDLYNASQRIPSQNLDLTPNPIGDAKSGFEQKYLPGDDYSELAKAADNAARAGVASNTPAGNRNKGGNRR